ncbi:MAG: hypothetical protein OEY81_07515 [Candidatus Bathyarchaeota archaeon]|nr:hypothetical protein [Candidatus Bathyarchaeota archaeon]
MAPRRKSQPVQVEEQVDWTPKTEEKAHVADIRTTLKSIKSREGIIGYILRGANSASVDIKDPSKIIDYAALSAEAAESGESLSSTFGLGNIDNIILEGKSLKLLSFTKDEQQVSIFMEKDVDHNAIYKEIE